MLRDQFDLVLLDAGPVGADWQLAQWASWAGVVRVDAAYVVLDGRAHKGEQAQQVARRLSVVRVRVAGTIEAFSDEAEPEPSTARPLALSSPPWK